MNSTQRHHRIGRRIVLGTVLVAGPILAAGGQPTGASPVQPPPQAARSARPFAPVLEGVVDGDLLLIGNSNLWSAGAWSPRSEASVDVDGDATVLCAARRRGGDGFGGRPWAGWTSCADNSSSADLDLPTGARVIAARLYVETSVGDDIAPLRVDLDGPADGLDHVTLPAEPPRPDAPATAVAPGEPVKLYEASDGGDRVVLRQAVWDVTSYVGAGGAGRYTVADIVNERTGPWLPYASWGLVVAYDLDPAIGPAGIAAGQEHRFRSRFVSWHDGFEYLETGALDLPIGGLPPVDGAATFGKTLHIVGHGRTGSSDNLLFAGGPLGNNATPGDSPPPAGVTLGLDPACNTVTDVQNDSICVLGTTVTAKVPDGAGLRSSADGHTPSSGSGVDMDVIRIPDRQLRAAGSDAVVTVQLTGGDRLAPGMIAVSIDVAPGAR